MPNFQTKPRHNFPDDAGQSFEKYQPVIAPQLHSGNRRCDATQTMRNAEVKKISPGGTRVQVTWCFVACLHG